MLETDLNGSLNKSDFVDCQIMFSSIRHLFKHKKNCRKGWEENQLKENWPMRQI